MKDPVITVQQSAFYFERFNFYYKGTVFCYYTGRYKKYVVVNRYLYKYIIKLSKQKQKSKQHGNTSEN